MNDDEIYTQFENELDNFDKKIEEELNNLDIEVSMIEELDVDVVNDTDADVNIEADIEGVKEEKKEPVKFNRWKTGRTKTDKIFDNKYEEKELDIVSNFNFRVDPAYDDSTDPDDDLHQKLLYDELHALIQKSEFSNLNKLDENGKSVKLNKIQINTVYSYIIKNISKGYSRLELWATLSEYFDIYPNKFYSSLSNIFKHELVMELDKQTDILERKKIKKLF